MHFAGAEEPHQAKSAFDRHRGVVVRPDEQRWDVERRQVWMDVLFLQIGIRYRLGVRLMLVAEEGEIA